LDTIFEIKTDEKSKREKIQGQGKNASDSPVWGIENVSRSKIKKSRQTHTNLAKTCQAISSSTISPVNQRKRILTANTHTHTHTKKGRVQNSKQPSKATSAVADCVKMNQDEYNGPKIDTGPNWATQNVSRCVHHPSQQRKNEGKLGASLSACSLSELDQT
jgi:hypothetical protein